MEKTIFITGASSGIGLATVRLFLSKGWNVIGYDVNICPDCPFPDLDGQKIPDERFMFILGDTRNREILRDAVSRGIAKFGGLHAVFACAGVHHSDTLTDLDFDELDRLIQINILGTVNTLHATIPQIIASGGGAAVINASDQSLIGKPHSFSYGLSKGALGQIAKSLALDLAPRNIRVNAVCPGTIRTPMVDSIFERCESRGDGDIATLWNEESALFPMGRVGTAEEIARTVWFLASEESSFITGALLPVDGGLTAG